MNQAPSSYTDIDDPDMRDSAVFINTLAWLEQAVIGLNLCPFAKVVHKKGQIRYRISAARDTDLLFSDLCSELQVLTEADPDVIDTTLLIHPFVLSDFAAYNEFLSVADVAVRSFGLEGVIQIASFHPNYQFNNSLVDDIENYTNRSPYPMLHLLREKSVERAIHSVADADRIVERNLDTLRQLGVSGWQKLPFIVNGQ